MSEYLRRKDEYYNKMKREINNLTKKQTKYGSYPYKTTLHNDSACYNRDNRKNGG